MNDIRELLEHAAGDDPVGFTTDDVERRVHTRARRRRLVSVVGLFLVLGGGLAAIASMTGDRDQLVATSGAPVTAEDLIGRWVLAEFNGRKVVSDDIHIEFGADGQAAGQAFCNSFQFSWSLVEGHLSIPGEGLIGMTLAGCGDSEMELMSLFGGAQVERGPGPGESILLRRDETVAIYVRPQEPDPEIVGDVADEVLPFPGGSFRVIHVAERSRQNIGFMGAATDSAALAHLWEDLGLPDGPPVPDIDFEREVVVALVIPDGACAHELVDIVVDGLVRMPVFQQPGGGCIEPLIPKTYVVALSHELAPSGSILRYPDDPELQARREGPTEIPIWPDDAVPPTGTTTEAVEVHFGVAGWGADEECAATAPVLREVPADGSVEDKVFLAVEQLLAGPTSSEHAEGLWSFFGPDTKDALIRVDVDHGRAHVDLDAAIATLNNASTSCGSAALLSSLTRTITQFDGVDSAVFYLAGDAAAFYDWLGMVTPPEAHSASW